MAKTAIHWGELIYGVGSAHGSVCVYHYAATQILTLLEGAASGNAVLRNVIRVLDGARPDTAVASVALDDQQFQKLRRTFDEALRLLPATNRLPNPRASGIAPDGTNASPAQRRPVFVSHASGDRAEAEALVSALAAHGIKCWIAPEGIPLGEHFEQAIVEGIRETDTTLLLLSQRSNSSLHVLSEVNISVNHFSPVITVRLENVQPSAGLMYYTAGQQWVDLFGGVREHDRNVQSLADRLLSEPVASSASGKVFVIHAREDRDAAEDLVQTLDVAGTRCWIAPRDIPSGSDFTGEIISAINAADGALVLLSSSANLSSFVGTEIARTQKWDKRLIPVRIENVAPASHIELHLGTRPTFDLSAGCTHRDGNLRRLVDELRANFPQHGQSRRGTVAMPPACCFVSHAATDRHAAYRLVAELEASGVTCWIAPRNVSPGMNSGPAILQAIQGTKATLLVVPAQSDTPFSVQMEIERATQYGKIVIPVRFHDVQPCNELGPYIRKRQWIDIWDHDPRRGENLKKLVADIIQIQSAH
jgi:hypothetical protein